MEMEKVQYIQKFHISTEYLQKACHQQQQLHFENNFLVNWSTNWLGLHDLLTI